MKNNFYFKEPFSNIYKLPNIHSEVTSQILYGERFKILSKRKSWIKIKSLYDRYSGFIKSKNYVNKFINLQKKYKFSIIEIHNRPSYIKQLNSKIPDSIFSLYFHNDPLSMDGSKTM